MLLAPFTNGFANLLAMLISAAVDMVKRKERIRRLATTDAGYDAINSVSLQHLVTFSVILDPVIFRDFFLMSRPIAGAIFLLVHVLADFAAASL